MLKTKLHFQRFEFKYLISFDEFFRIREKIKQYVGLDGFAKDSKDGFYEVVSLYYDSPKFYYYHEKIDGAVNRKKIRLRTYKKNSEFVPNVFFEIKRKYDSVILKDRVLLDKKTHSFPKSNKITEEYEQEKYLRSLEPKILVSYKRQPFIGRYNKNFRVTFDYDIRAKETKDLFDPDLDVQVLSEKVVMEIKFNGILPYYIREIIDQYNLERIAYSKYCNAIEACYLLDEINFSKNYFLRLDKQLLTQQYERII
tara:strand:- start:486 stop:1247 length:762 start_codon:yes stop_codon:yes gene_type:complete